MQSLIGLDQRVLISGLRGLVHGGLGVVDDPLLLVPNLLGPFCHFSLSRVIFAETELVCVVSATTPDFAIVKEEERVKLSACDLDDPMPAVIVWMKSVDLRGHSDEIFVRFGSVERDTALSVPIQAPSPDDAGRVDGEGMVDTGIDVDDPSQTQSFGFEPVELPSLDDTPTELTGRAVTPYPDFAGRG